MKNRIHTFALLATLSAFASLAPSAEAKPAQPPTLVDAETVVERLRAHSFDPGAEVAIVKNDFVSEEEFVEKQVEISAGGEVYKFRTYFGNKNWIPDESSCTKAGNAITCVSESLSSETSGTMEDPGEERTICSQPVLVIAGSEDAKRILLVQKLRYWTANRNETCRIARENRAPITEMKIGKIRSAKKSL